MATRESAVEGQRRGILSGSASSDTGYASLPFHGTSALSRGGPPAGQGGSAMAADAEENVIADTGVSALFRKLRLRDEVDEEEVAVLRAAVSEVTDVMPGRVIIRSGTDVEVSTLLVEGIVCRYKDLASGERQIQELHVAGDFVDLHAFLLKRLDHNIGAVSRCRTASVPHERLKRITEDYPHLSRMLWFSTLLDASIQRETILSVGRRSALA